MLCTLPLFASVRKSFPYSNIRLIASKDNFRVFNSTSEKYIDELLLYDKSNPVKFSKFLLNLKNRQYDISIVPSTFSFSKTSHLIGYLSGAKFKVGVKSADGKPNKYAGYLNVKADFEWESKRLHQVDRFLEIGKIIGCEFSDEDKNSVRLTFSKQEKSTAIDFYRINFGNGSRKVVGIHTGAGKIQNRWSGYNFAELIKYLFAKTNCFFFLTNSQYDSEATNELLSHLDKNFIEKNIVFDNGMEIRNLAAVLSHFDLYITNDTGTMHIAAYSGTKVLSLFGPTNGYEWAPLMKQNIYLQSPDNDINSINVKTVIDKSLFLINE
jgi:heptosyltransferase-2